MVPGSITGTDTATALQHYQDRHPKEALPALPGQAP